MITVVVPTMWRFAPFIEFVKDIIKLDIVDEVIIIDNDTTRTPKDAVLKDPKVKLLNFGHNIYVNPAWNVGVNASKNDLVCILNDDLIFDLRLFYKVDEFFTPNMGVMGLSEGVVDLGQTPFSTGRITFEPYVGQNAYGFGELMFVHKQNWQDIPQGLDIGFGEVFIFERLMFQGRQNYFITDMSFHHEGSLTQREVPRPEAEERLQREQAIYNTIRPTLLPK